MPKEALYYEKLKNNSVQCHLCPKNCIIKPGQYGNCNSRKNIDGKLYSMVYGKPCSIAIDPIEKKPLYHFMPGEKVFSIGTTGCNLHCYFCQNWTTSQSKALETETKEITPKQLVDEAIESRCKIIAYTYNEPTIFFEYVLETAKLAHKKGIKNVLVSNGFINEKPLKELLPYIDAANIDLKSFDDNFYKKYCNARLEPVLNTLKTMQKSKIHIEITNLIIPGLNDDMKLIDKMCKWIYKNLGPNVPSHFSAFYPNYKMEDTKPATEETLLKAKKIAEKNKLRYIYIGNIAADNNTYCPTCRKTIIKREYFSASETNISNGSCNFCKEKIKGIWN